MHVMTVNYPDGSSTEVHMLNPGEHFPRFGGSSRGLTVGKTASLITRHRAVGHEDIERDIHDRNFWEWVAERINDPKGCTVTIPWADNMKAKA